ncbi:RNA polymerase sigma factor [Actinomadura macra]|uniref:RNA polymerase sigma factor n=1 Tax=Actinomadura macra TaxID=46164 RepID=UPI000B1113FE|nr:RNA polymerase sigma factor [Actinomadura macra]
MTVTDEALPHTPAPDPDAAGAGPGPAGETTGPATDVAGQVTAALAQDLDAGFAVLYEAYRGAVFSTALRLCGRWAEAEDLAAEAFLRAYRALCGYPPERIAALRPRAWLLTILTNLWRNGLRAAARRPPPTPLEDAPDPPDPAEPVEDAAARHETGRELAGLLDALPAAQRAAIVLRHVTDLPVAEIAAVLGLPEGTVKSHISRGLARLRTLHHPQGGTP